MYNAKRPLLMLGKQRARWTKYCEQVYGAPQRMKVPKNTFRKVCRSNGSRLQLKNSIRSPSSAIFLQNKKWFFSTLIILIFAFKMSSKMGLMHPYGSSGVPQTHCNKNSGYLHTITCQWHHHFLYSRSFLTFCEKKAKLCALAFVIQGFSSKFHYKVSEQVSRKLWERTVFDLIRSNSTFFGTAGWMTDNRDIWRKNKSCLLTAKRIGLQTGEQNIIRAKMFWPEQVFRNLNMIE